LLALVIGVLLLGVVGFTQLAVVHNVVHDGRHSFAFPCH
jgi:cobalt transporter subunit CbtB